MDKKIFVFLAEGFEEIEALTQVDVLRRAGAAVTTVGVTGKMVTGAHGIPVAADVEGSGFVLPAEADMVVLPGGGPGTERLAASELVAGVLREAAQRGIWIAAICAAPTVLRQAGLLEGKRATAFPGAMDDISTGEAVEVDGKIITGRSAGVSLLFARALLLALYGEAQARETIAKLHPEP